MSRITATAIAHKRDRAPLAAADKQIIAKVLTWDCQREVSPNEIETIAIQLDIFGCVAKTI